MNKKQEGLKKIIPYCYVAPMTMILVTFTLASIIVTFVLGFTSYDILTPPVFQGVSNYIKIISDIKFMKAFQNTSKLVIMIVPLQMVLGMIISVVLVENKDRFLGKIANWAIFIPFLCSNTVIGVVWRELLNGGIPLIDNAFGVFGIDPSMLLGDGTTALRVIAAVALWKWMGYYTVIFSSGLLGISKTYYEAAKVDGAGRIKSFFKITIPMMKPTIILALFLSFTTAMSNFELIYNLTGGGPNNATMDIVMYVYELCFKYSKAGYAMAVSNILFVIVVIIGLLQRRYINREVSEE